MEQHISAQGVKCSYSSHVKCLHFVTTNYIRWFLLLGPDSGVCNCHKSYSHHTRGILWSGFWPGQQRHRPANWTQHSNTEVSFTAKRQRLWFVYVERSTLLVVQVQRYAVDERGASLVPGGASDPHHRPYGSDQFPLCTATGLCDLEVPPWISCKNRYAGVRVQLLLKKNRKLQGLAATWVKSRQRSNLVAHFFLAEIPLFHVLNARITFGNVNKCSTEEEAKPTPAATPTSSGEDEEAAGGKD